MAETNPEIPAQEQATTQEQENALSTAHAQEQKQVKKDGRRKDPNQPTLVPFQLVTLTNRNRLAAIGKADDATLSLLLDAYENQSNADSSKIAAENKQLRDQIKELQKQLKAAAQATDAAKAENLNLHTEIAALKQQIAAKEQLIAASDADMTELKEEVIRLRQDSTSSVDTETRIQELKSKLQTMTDRATRAEDEVKDNKTLIKGLQDAKHYLEEKLNGVQDELHNAQESYISIQRENNRADVNTYPEGDILHFFPTITAKLLDLTAHKLTAVRKDGTEITPAMVLGDMFNRYTIDQFNLWFYKWVVTDKEIIDIAMSVDERLTSIKMIRAALGIK